MHFLNRCRKGAGVEVNLLLTRGGRRKGRPGFQKRAEKIRDWSFLGAQTMAPIHTLAGFHGKSAASCPGYNSLYLTVSHNFVEISDAAGVALKKGAVYAGLGSGGSVLAFESRGLCCGKAGQKIILKFFGKCGETLLHQNVKAKHAAPMWEREHAAGLCCG
jgi:hypothetical protein